MGREHYRHRVVVKNGSYEKTLKKVLSVRTVEEIDHRVTLAKQWHNPLNYDDGSPIKKRHGWNTLFTDHIRGKRFYFPFRDLKNYKEDTILAHFLASKNMKTYVRAWVKNAPEEFRHYYYYFIMLVEVTRDGMTHESSVIDKLRKKGHDVRVSTWREDYRQGVDAWVDGKPLQIKSPATELHMK